MSYDQLKILAKPTLREPILIMGLSGWMDGGQVSTGAIECIVEELDTAVLAEIDPNGFYIHNFPGTMEVTSMFRPHTVIKDGMVKEFQLPGNIFWVSEVDDVIFFIGDEPNINWDNYIYCLFEFCREFNVKKIYSLGSVAGLIPHTRDPRYYCTVSDSQLKTELDKMGFHFSNYNGPAGISAYMIHLAHRYGLQMATIVAEIPAYVHGRNPKCIASMSKHISAILGLGVSLDPMVKLGEELERKLTEIILDREELSKHISKLEQDYDNKIFDTEMGDLKDWLHKQGIRLD